MVETVYEQEEQQAEVDPKLLMEIDMGVNVLAAITSNKEGYQPKLVSGKPIKSLNQGYNKLRAKHQTRLSKGKHPTDASRALEQITTKRNRRIKQYLHTASRQIIHEC